VAIPAIILDAPAAFVPRPGLFDAAVGPMDMPAHADTSGGTWWSEVCGLPRLYPPACQSPPYPSFTLDAADGLVSAFPYVAYASQVCGVVGVSNQEAARIVRQKLVLGEQYAAEQALWHGGGGVTGIFEQLQAAGKVTTTAASANMVEGVSLLEQQLGAAYLGPMTIHARPRLAAWAATKNLVKVQRTSDGEKLKTHFGSQWIFGAGYAGTGPTGQAVGANDEWMWITGRVFVWRDPEIFVSPPDQMINTTTNQRGLYASRAYMIGIECLPIAVTNVTRNG
jgi:hypothetical protein